MLEDTAVKKLHLRQLKFKLFFSEKKLQACAQNEKKSKKEKTVDGDSDLSEF